LSNSQGAKIAWTELLSARANFKDLKQIKRDLCGDAALHLTTTLKFLVEIVSGRKHALQGLDAKAHEYGKKSGCRVGAAATRRDICR
jgi:hypothetical protein